MIDFRDDGLTTIDFEDGEGLVTVRRPKFGAFTRLRAEAARLQTVQEEKRVEFNERAQQDREEREAEDAPDEVKNRVPFDAVSAFEAAVGELVSGWWLLALRGDDTFKGLADRSVPEPAEWPSWMIIGTAVDEDMPTITLPNSGTTIVNRKGIIFLVLDQWRKVPLARGGQPVSPPNPSANGHSQVAGLTR